MMRGSVRAALALAAVLNLPAASLPQRIEELISSSPAVRAAFWGIEIVDLASGKTLYEQNAGRLFVPASNAKLFTTALSLVRLGPDFTFATRVIAENPPDNQGTISGSLRLVGGGDPNLSARLIPYSMTPATGDPLASIEELADQVAGRGVKRVEGGVVGDDTWYVWEPYGTGWAVDDVQADDGPPVSALSINDNIFTLSVRPGMNPGDPAALSLRPPGEFYILDNRVRTTPAGTERAVHFDRQPGSRQARLWGTVPVRDRGQDLFLSIDDPALYGAMALRTALERRGITVTGEAVVRHRFANEVADLTRAPAAPPESGVELALHKSAPLLEDLRIIAKVSQNLHAELALRAVARARRGIGSFEAGREEFKAFLSEAGIDSNSYDLQDGSGLSRLNLVTPGAVVKLLRYMFELPARDNWVSLLPIGGEDGTLNTRFADSPKAGKVYAKTGSLAHVSALSGYVERNDGRWVAFSILANNYQRANAEIRGVIDRICTLIME